MSLLYTLLGLILALLSYLIYVVHTKTFKPTKWHELAPSVPKGERPKLTEDHYYKYLNMHEETIFEQKELIARLRMQLNQLRQRNK